MKKGRARVAALGCALWMTVGKVGAQAGCPAHVAPTPPPAPTPAPVVSQPVPVPVQPISVPVQPVSVPATAAPVFSMPSVPTVPNMPTPNMTPGMLQTDVNNMLPSINGMASMRAPNGTNGAIPGGTIDADIITGNGPVYSADIAGEIKTTSPTAPRGMSNGGGSNAGMALAAINSDASVSAARAELSAIMSKITENRAKQSSLRTELNTLVESHEPALDAAFAEAFMPLQERLLKPLAEAYDKAAADFMDSQHEANAELEAWTKQQISKIQSMYVDPENPGPGQAKQNAAIAAFKNAREARVEANEAKAKAGYEALEKMNIENDKVQQDVRAQATAAAELAIKPLTDKIAALGNQIKSMEDDTDKASQQLSVVSAKLSQAIDSRVAQLNAIAQASCGTGATSAGGTVKTETASAGGAGAGGGAAGGTASDAKTAQTKDDLDRQYLNDQMANKDDPKALAKLTEEYNRGVERLTQDQVKASEGKDSASKNNSESTNNTNPSSTLTYEEKMRQKIENDPDLGDRVKVIGTIVDGSGGDPRALLETKDGPPDWYNKPVSELTPRQKLELLESAIRKHERNAELMGVEYLKDKPDAKLLKDKLATASGERTEAYKHESAYVKDLIDIFESDGHWTSPEAWLNMGYNLRDAKDLALHLASAKGQYFVELSRTERFLTKLHEEKKRALKEMGLAPTVWEQANKSPADGFKGTYKADNGSEIKFIKDDGLVKGVIVGGEGSGKTVFIGSPGEGGAVKGEWSLPGQGDKEVLIKVGGDGSVKISPTESGGTPLDLTATR